MAGMRLDVPWAKAAVGRAQSVRPSPDWEPCALGGEDSIGVHAAGQGCEEVWPAPGGWGGVQQVRVVRRHHFQYGLVWDDPASRSGLQSPRDVQVLGGWQWPGVGRGRRYWAHPSGADSSVWSAGDSARQQEREGLRVHPVQQGVWLTQSSSLPSFGDGRQQLWVDLRIDEPCSGQHLWFEKITPLERRTTPYLKPHQGLGPAGLDISLPRLCPAHPRPAGPSTAWLLCGAIAVHPGRPRGHPPAGLPPTCVHGCPRLAPRGAALRADTRSDPQEIVDWFNALRAARFHYLQVAFPGASDADVSAGGLCLLGLGRWPRVSTYPLLSSGACQLSNSELGGRGEGAGDALGESDWEGPGLSLSSALVGPEALPELPEGRLHGENGAQGGSDRLARAPQRLGSQLPRAGVAVESQSASNSPRQGLPTHHFGVWMALDPTTFCKRGPCGARTVGLWVEPSLPRAFAPFHRSLEGQTRPLPCLVDV